MDKRAVVEGRRVLATRRYEDLNEMYQDPKTGGRIFVGNISAASTKSVLEKNSITAVVNCQSVQSQNYFEEDPTFTYFRWPVSFWRVKIKPVVEPGTVLKYFSRLFEFLDAQLAEGKSVLIHCLAGAHRAGSTGISVIMRYHKLPFTKALEEARARRPIIDPIGSFPEMLGMLSLALEEKWAEEESSADLKALAFSEPGAGAGAESEPAGK